MSAYRRSAFEWLLYPGLQLMRRLKFAAKTAVMGLLLLVPLTWITGQALIASHAGLDGTRQEAAGAPLVKQLLALTAQTQKHRGLVNRAQAGDTTVAAALDENRAALEASTRALDSTLALLPEFDLATAWEPIRAGVRQVLGAEKDANSFKLHTDLVEQQRVFLSRCAEASGLLLDPEAAPFHLMHLAVEPVVAWTEALGQLRGRGAALLRKGEMNVADNAALAAQLQLLRQATANAQMIAGALERAGEKLPDGLTRALASSKAYAELAEATFSTLTPQGDPAAYFDAGTKAIKGAVDVGNATADRLQTLLGEREQRLQRQWVQQWCVGVGTVLLVAYLAAAFFHNSFAAVRVLQGSVTLLANGDFSNKVKLRATDELTVVAGTLDGMTARLSAMVADIRSNSSIVAQAGFQLSDATRSLSDRTVAQAASLEETGASVQELSDAVRANAQGAEAASGRAATVRAMAEEGGTAIQSAVTSMQEIQTSSARVQEIVGVIEGIAFQTNILALNAAVEAARAGEQGRGFAVVASEVRSLAQRSAASAKEIKSLIAASAEKVAKGVRQIDGASTTFAQIVSGIREVAQSLQVIRTNTAEQSVGLDQVANAVGQIDAITQQNARMVETASYNSAQLTERADQLAQAVESFKLRQGSADEAAALVRQASALFVSNGASALAQISAAGSSFADRDMYVFAFDRQGVYRAFGGNPAKVGTPVSANPGVDAQKLVADAFDQVGRGGGWVDYSITNPTTGQVDAKTSYVLAAGKDLLLGCGVYKARDFGKSLATHLQPARLIRAEQRLAGSRVLAPGRQLATT